MFQIKPIGCLLRSAALLSVAAAPPLHADIVPSDVRVVHTDDAGWFRVTIEAPEDHDWRFDWSRKGRLLAPALRATGGGGARVFCEDADGDEWAFVGRFEGDVLPPLELRYRVEGGWTIESLSINAEVAQWSVEDPARSWARAGQADFNRRAARITEDGGFNRYAASRLSAIHDLEGTDPVSGGNGWNRNGQPSRYEVVIGTAAMEESLQLRRMLSADSRGEEQTIPVADIRGVDVPAHDYDELRGSTEVRHSRLAGLVPADQYYARFSTLGAMLESLDIAEDWGGTFVRSFEGVGFDYDTRERLLTQLCLIDDARARKLGMPALKQVAVTGSDPFVSSGGDVTLLFEAGHEQLMSRILDMPWNRTRVQMRDVVKRSFSDYGEHRIESLTTPDRVVSSHRCFAAGVYIYSNSLVGVHRVLDVIAGERPALASTPDFQYFRASIYPFSDDESGFVYLGDSFIRRVTGPAMRIAWNRRMEVAASLGTLRNAALFHAWQTGEVPDSIGAMSDSGSLDVDDLYDPWEGSFAWNEEAFLPQSTTANTLAALTPLIELPVTTVSRSEADAYEQFRDRYTSYWRDVFDPIGIRIALGKDVRIDTHITPLINNTWYEQQREWTAGEPVDVRVHEFSDDTMLRVVARLHHGHELRRVLAWGEAMAGDAFALDWVGDWATLWVEDRDAFEIFFRGIFDVDGRSEQNVHDIFQMTLVVGVHTKNKLNLAAFLTGLKVTVDTVAPNLVRFDRMEDHGGIGIVRISPEPDGEFQQLMEMGAEEAGREFVAPGLYYATIQDGWYISTQERAIRGRIDAGADNSDTEEEIIPANELIYLDLSEEKGPRTLICEIIEMRARQQANVSMELIALLGDCGLIREGDDPDAAVKRVFGVDLSGPNGDTWTWDASAHRPVSSVYGHGDEGTVRETLNDDAPFRDIIEPLQRAIAAMVFTDDDGIAVTLRVRRDKPEPTTVPGMRKPGAQR